MRVSELEYSRTFNLGEYESERIGLKVTVEESENPFDVFKDTKALVLSFHDEGKQIEESRKTATEEQPTEQQLEYDLMKVRTKQVEGSHGPYLQGKKEDNQNNPDFEALLKDLEDHGGKLSRQGYFVWLFDKTSTPTLGMKPRKH